ncbi:hypothetical protein [Streptomyces sp. NPDC007369]|uniref:hypothetical protein n=1 Tax=Streptomyces sp. NPDC007369 TaxID=3154589 RepID=UPI00340B85B3
MERLTRKRARTGLAVLVLAAASLAAAPQAALAESHDVDCDGKWHFEPVGTPKFERVIADTLTIDNRNGSEPLQRTERTKESATRQFSHSVDLGYEVEAEASASFGIFSGSLRSKFSAAYKFAVTDSNTVEKESEVKLIAGVGEGYTYNVGLQTVKIDGYYERILDCDQPTQRYQRIGPVTEEAPLKGKAIWTEKLPALKKES